MEGLGPPEHVGDPPLGAPQLNPPMRAASCRGVCKASGGDRACPRRPLSTPLIKASQPDPSDPGPAASRATPGSLMGFGVRRLARLAPPTQPPDKKVQRTVDATSVSCPPLKGQPGGPPVDTPTGPTRLLLFAKTRPLQKPRVRCQTRSAWPFFASRRPRARSLHRECGGK